MESSATLSSKGQLVLPKEARKKLGLKKGDRLKIDVDEKTKTIVIRPQLEPPREIFIRAGTKMTGSILEESNKQDELKTKKLLRAIGVV